MSDEIILNENSSLPSDLVYQRGQNDSENQPEFKPGDTPHTQYGDEMLKSWSTHRKRLQA